MNTKKIIFLICLQIFVALHGSVLDVRTKSSSSLLYNMMDMKKEGRVYHFTVSPLGGGSFDRNSMAEVVTVNGKSYFTLNEYNSVGSATVQADMNPLIIQLTDATSGHGHAGSYKSEVTLSPQVKTLGALLHFYTRCHKSFFDVRSGLLLCKTHINIDETGGGTGQHLSIKTFKNAMTNERWDYGKMGEEQKVFGLDNIQIKLGAFKHFYEGSASESDNCLAGFLLVEVPTGKGTKAEWVFEPRVGKNHFGFGAGLEEYYTNDRTQAMVGVNWRYLFGAKETRSFDLKKNGPWSRYIKVVSIPAPTTVQKSSPGINVLTRQAKVILGNQVNTYFRWNKQWEDLRCEVAYNFMYQQKESIVDVVDASSKFGVFHTINIAGNTSSNAKMNSLVVAQDSSQIETLISDLDLDSGAVGAIMNSSISLRCDRVKNHIIHGVGGAIEIPHSKSAFASWNVWANLGIMF